ncbi:hypothetical protein ACI3L3_04750 [Desulfobaculum sp. SPO524]|uniref:hypothetical protein n=1 Tax=Desulfobaculum sp. SPO524 TaxID=3378071 RepID=UPI0038533425
MSEEINIELKKPLEKMTIKELRELAIAEIPQITGASGMDKDTLLAAIKEVLGITDDDENKGNPYQGQIARIKKELNELRAKKLTVAGRKEREIIRKKINKLKKYTRRLAHSA